MWAAVCWNPGRVSEDRNLPLERSFPIHLIVHIVKALVKLSSFFTQTSEKEFIYIWDFINMSLLPIFAFMDLWNGPSWLSCIVPFPLILLKMKTPHNSFRYPSQRVVDAAESAVILATGKRLPLSNKVQCKTGLEFLQKKRKRLCPILKKVRIRGI